MSENKELIGQKGAVKPDWLPHSWGQYFTNTSIFVNFRNIEHFKHYVSKVKQKDDKQCGVSYSTALDDLLRNKATISKDKYELVKNTVRNNLLKRGLISETCYESYEYHHEGDIIDYSKLAEMDPNCCLVPSEKYINYFHELFINISYPYYVDDSTVRDNMAKILATIECLEHERIYIKVSLVFFGSGSIDTGGNFLSVMPLFHHKETKTIELMSSILNERLLRKFYFAIMETELGDKLSASYGMAIKPSHCVDVWDVKEVDLVKDIYKKLNIEFKDE